MADYQSDANPLPLRWVCGLRRREHRQRRPGGRSLSQDDPAVGRGRGGVNLIHAHVSIRRITVLFAMAAALVFGLLPGFAAAKPHGGHGRSEDRGKGKEVNVMTRNLYLGADLAPAIAAPDRN